MTKGKSCSRCDQWKTLDEFAVMPHAPQGRSSWCKECHRAHTRKIRAKFRRTGNYKKVNKKTCSVCKTEKAITDFFKRSGDPDGYGSSCKRCHTENTKLSRRKLRADLIAGYGGVCACCGESRPEFLQLDHIHNDGAEERRSLMKPGSKSNLPAFMGLYRKLRRLGYPRNRHQLLCANCNFAKGIYGICPHQKERENQSCQ